MDVKDDDFDLASISQSVLDCISSGTLGEEPIRLLLRGSDFIPKEGWVWDYKESLPKDTLSLAKTVLQVVSFHNTCGGYIIYGVREAKKDINFIPKFLDVSAFNPAQLRDKIKHYTSISIDISFAKVSLTIESEDYDFGLLYIPKRHHAKKPVSFLKNGPEKSPGNPIFKADEVYYRHLDECSKASSVEDWRMLFSSRILDGTNGINPSDSILTKKTLSHNLPDKNLICANFIGREDVLSKLWEWIADDFEYTKILAGDGGKGKTSIAYRFCRSFTQTSPSGYERVVWLSVKERQFSAIENNFYELQDADFLDYKSFLECLAEWCALKTTDYEDFSHKVIKRDLQSALGIFPSLIVVDDIDSLEEEEQRKVVDACRQLGQDKVRFLITTRKKLAYSADVCINVPGMDIDDFFDLTRSISKSVQVRNLSPKETRRLHEACDGSPLLATSIIRLCRQGEDLGVAIKAWSGYAGEDARNAALRREIEALSADAKRLLLVVAYFHNCSYTELRQAVGYETLRMSDSLEELQSMFLVNEPRLIENEERFTISNTTALIVAEMKSDMAFDYQSLQKTVRRQREGPSTKKVGNRKRVGLAINQALALVRDERFEDAIDTVDRELKNQKGNQDLLLMKARCFMSMPKPRYEAASKLLRVSVGSGQRKELAYDLWFEAEATLDSPNGMVECATKALDLNDSDRASWSEKLARGLIYRARVRSGDAAVTDLLDASEALKETLQSSGKLEKQNRIHELSALHDLIWSRIEADNNFSWLSCFDILHKLIEQGDARTVMYRNATRCLVEAREEETNFSSKKKEAYEICVRKLQRLIDSRSERDKLDRPFDDLLDSVADEAVSSAI